MQNIDKMNNSKISQSFENLRDFANFLIYNFDN